jgi:hypothetical protein
VILEFGRQSQFKSIFSIGWLRPSSSPGGQQRRFTNGLFFQKPISNRVPKIQSQWLPIPEIVCGIIFPKTRLDLESMRDTLLQVAGNLDRKMGGLQEDIMDPTSNRRTVYSYFDRTEPPGIFRTFDHPSPNATAPGRFETIVPQQALFLMNSPFTIRQAKFLADRVNEEAGDEAESRIREFYKVVFQRDATEEEILTAVEFISGAETYASSVAAIDSEDSDAKQPLTGWQLYAQVLLLSNELIFVD